MFRRLSKPSFVHISPTTHSAVSKYTDLRTLFTKRVPGECAHSPSLEVLLIVASCVKISKRSERWWEMYEGTSGSVAHTTSRALISTTTLPLVYVCGEGVGGCEGAM